MAQRSNARRKEEEQGAEHGVKDREKGMSWSNFQRMRGACVRVGWMVGRWTEVGNRGTKCCAAGWLCKE
eukprot:1880416-Rhodomonas_salina.1